MKIKQTKYDKQEKTILKLPHRYLVFLDEVGNPEFHRDIKIYQDRSVYPVLTITAAMVSRVVYGDILMPGLDEIKEYFFRNKNIYFHSREIRRKDGIFKIFLGENKYSKFKNLVDSLIERSSVVFVSSSINKLKLLEKAKKFEKSSGEKYDTGDLYLRCLGFVLERAGHFLSSDSGKIIFERRGKKESKRIQAVLDDAKRDGTFYCPKERFKNIDKEILFFDKSDNINGLQVADYCTYPFSRHAKNPKDKNNMFFDFLRKFVYQGDFGEYGLKEWP